MPARKPAAPARAAARFTPEERAAMRARARETAALDPEADLAARIADMPPGDRALAERVDALVRAAAPHLRPRTWYGMPAWANDDGVVCYFQSAAKFKTRYATLGFSGRARLDDGELWPTAYALTALSPETENRITALIRKAVKV